MSLSAFSSYAAPVPSTGAGEVGPDGRVAWRGRGVECQLFLASALFAGDILDRQVDIRGNAHNLIALVLL
jgi:hypothetical protein